MFRTNRAQRRRRGRLFLVFSAVLLVWLSVLCTNSNLDIVPTALAQGTDTTKPSSTTTTTVGTKTAVKKKEETESDGLSLSVIDLTSTTFDSSVNDGNVWLIEFYTSWCKHCQNFKTSYQNVAHTFHSNPKEKIRVAKVECTVEKALATRFGVAGYPSFYLVSGHDVYEYDGMRSESNLIAFARGGYKKEDPIPFLTSPMGPMGMLQGGMIYVGTSVMGFLDTLQEKYGIPPIFAGVGICMLGVFGGMISIVLLTVLSTPREKVD